MSDDIELVARFRLSYAYQRSTGPVIGRCLAGLRAGRLLGVRSATGEVLFPAREYDPRTGEAVTDEVVEVGPEGTIATWTWVDDPPADAPVEGPFAWALVTLDGCDAPFLHVVRGPKDAVRTGARVRAVFADTRVGSMRDLAFLEVVG